MTAVFAFAAIYSGAASHDLKVGLATALIVDVIGAFFVFAVYTRFDTTNRALELPLSIAMFGSLLVILFLILGYDLYAFFAVIAVIRCGYDSYLYFRTPLAESHLHARKHFTTYLKIGIPMAFIVLLSIISPDSLPSIESDEQVLGCEAAICGLVSPPEPYILFGLVLYPLIGWLNFKWQPHWMRLVPRPKHRED